MEDSLNNILKGQARIEAKVDFLVEANAIQETRIRAVEDKINWFQGAAKTALLGAPVVGAFIGFLLDRMGLMP